MTDNKMIAQTPVMKQFLDIKSQYDDTLVLFRMGDFYETFLEDAKITAKILGIVLTKRANGKAADVDLAGFPYHALDNYLPKLVKAGHRVAICEQVEDPKLSKGIVKREVLEVVTPGTLISDQALSKKSNRYICSIYFGKKFTGLAFLDQSTGELHLGECVHSQLKEYLLKFAPNEIIIADSIVYSNSEWYRELHPFITQINDWLFDFEISYKLLKNHFQIRSLKGFGCDKMKFGITACGALFTHIKENLGLNLEHISKIRPILNENYMGLDGFTIRNLEVFQSLSTQGTHGTLVDCIDRTKTSGGGRMLRRWLHHPLIEKNLIDNRLNLVESFIKNKNLLKPIQDGLSKTVDIERIIGRLNRGKVSPREILGLAQTLNRIPEWKDNFNNSQDKNLINLSKSFVNTSNIVNEILSKINIDTPAQLKLGNVICQGIQPELDELRILLSSNKEWINNFQKNLREKLNIPKLKVGFNKVFGYFIEVTKVHLNKVPNNFIRKQTLVNSERYITEELKEYEVKILHAEEEIYKIECKIFNHICRLIINEIVNIHSNARIINKIDLLTSFASLAINQNYTRPKLSNIPQLKIEQGRHPVVEQLLPSEEKYIPNNLFIDSNRNQIHFITGPNMAGKSTYLRQTGLIVLLAQIGCFVPAESANIGIVDRLFTRVGASDNLAGGESTFLVEMNEAANILNNATDNSLIILDEIGRGTATYDGLSLAWAITEYLHDKEGVKARTLFATHYHELTDLENILDRVENHHIQVKEFKDKIIFLRSIAKGAGDKSYGIYVAKMAGLPNSIISRASEILEYHINKSENRYGKNMKQKLSEEISINYEKELFLRKKLDELDLNNITPIEALQILDDIKKENDI